MLADMFGEEKSAVFLRGFLWEPNKDSDREADGDAKEKRPAKMKGEETEATAKKLSTVKFRIKR